MLPRESGFFHLAEGIGDPSVLCVSVLSSFLLLRVFHCMDVSQFVYSFTSCGMLGLFPIWGNCK